jgi:hypothetical protein
VTDRVNPVLCGFDGFLAQFAVFFGPLGFVLSGFVGLGELSELLRLEYILVVEFVICLL